MLLSEEWLVFVSWWVVAACKYTSARGNFKKNDKKNNLVVMVSGRHFPRLHVSMVPREATRVKSAAECWSVTWSRSLCGERVGRA